MYRAMKRNQKFEENALAVGEAAQKEMNGEGLPVVRSTFMQAEEIERERELSGWNPYLGEEEESQELSGQTETVPYFMRPDYAQIMEESREAERELRKLQSMYPESAKLLLPYVEDECDKMEYEGSPMFDEYPDRSTIYRIEEHICEQAQTLLPKESHETEEVPSLQDLDSGMGPNARGGNWARELVRVLLLNEIHHRRCRHAAVQTKLKHLPFPGVSGIV